MSLSESRGTWTKVIVVQLLIAAALVGLYKLYLPRMEREEAAARAAERERKLQAFVHLMIVEDPSRQANAVGADGEKIAHPQKLLEEDSLSEVQQALGAPDTVFTDFRGGEHFTWKGTRHDLEAAFNKGVLYNLSYENRQSGHGVSVFASSEYWQSF